MDVREIIRLKNIISLHYLLPTYSHLFCMFVQSSEIQRNLSYV